MSAHELEPEGPIETPISEATERQLLEALLEVAVFATGYQTRRSKAPAMRANGKTDERAAKTDTVLLLRANGFRQGASIYNDSTATLYVKLGPHADVDDWSVKLGAGDYYEPPARYRGAVTGVWSAVNGQARVTEFE